MSEEDMVRKVITIDENLCNGCGVCIPNCPEGAIQIIDNKARLISDLFCDGLGACLGHCPEGAITIEEREAEPYEERRVMENVVKQGENTILAHLEHLSEHGETEYLAIAKAYLAEKKISIPEVAAIGAPQMQGCPGSRMREIERTEVEIGGGNGNGAPQPSELTQWPIQLHLVPPSAPWLKDRELLLSADCVAFALGDFHKNHLKGRALSIACPKLDSEQDIYIDKLSAIIDHSGVKSIEVMMMQVPCCRGLLYLVEQATEKATNSVPVSYSIVSVEGEILRQQTVSS